MSARGVEFLENWIAKDVTAGAPPYDPLSASVLAMRCIAEAAAEGLTVEKMMRRRFVTVGFGGSKNATSTRLCRAALCSPMKQPISTPTIRGM